MADVIENAPGDAKGVGVLVGVAVAVGVGVGVVVPVAGTSECFLPQDAKAMTNPSAAARLSDLLCNTTSTSFLFPQI